jgi:hypothetical protein
VSLSTFQKVVYYAAVPLTAASIGAFATYQAGVSQNEQITITGDAAKAAKDGKLTIEIVRKDATEDKRTPWPAYFAAPGMLLGLAAMLWASDRR